MTNDSRSIFRRMGSWIDSRVPMDLEEYFQCYLRLKEWNRIRKDVRLRTEEITQTLEEIKREVEETPNVTAVRVGARNRPWEGNLYPLHKTNLLDLHTIEPDEEECERLSKVSDRNYEFHSKGLSDHEGEQTLYLTEAGATSSLYKPTIDNLGPFPWIHSRLNVQEQVPIQTTTLNQLCRERNIDPDIILLDTQGSELDILQGSDELLDDVFIVQLEARTVPMYQDEPLLPEILGWMDDRDFRVLDLDFQRWGTDGFVNGTTRPEKQGYQLNAETIEVHPLFGNRRDTYGKKEALQRIIVSISLGKFTVANRVLNGMEECQDKRRIEKILNTDE